jgi:hypothetical protein
MSYTFSFPELEALAGGRWSHRSGAEIADVICPSCGPLRRTAAHRKERKLRLFRHDDGFIGYRCAHCEDEGFVLDGAAPRPSPAQAQRFRAEATKQRGLDRTERLSIARWLWSCRRPGPGSILETYLRARGYRGPIPRTLGLLPASTDYPPSMIAAYGMAHETAPGELAIADAAVTGIQITRLLPDGSWRERGEDAKKTIGHDITEPILLAPPNGLLGLCIAEGIEKALIAHQATGLGAWASGGASRLPGLARHVPSYIETVTIVVDADDAGRVGSEKLADLLCDRGFEVRKIPAGGRHGRP